MAATGIALKMPASGVLELSNASASFSGIRLYLPVLRLALGDGDSGDLPEAGRSPFAKTSGPFQSDDDIDAGDLHPGGRIGQTGDL